MMASVSTVVAVYSLGASAPAVWLMVLLHVYRMESGRCGPQQQAIGRHYASGCLGLRGASPPQSCPTSPLLQTLSGSGGGLGGKSPVFTNAVLVAPVWHVEQGQTTPLPYPGTKFLWEVGPNFTRTVRLEVTNLGTGEGGWWGQTGTPVTTYLVLDSSATGPTYAEYHNSPGPGYPVPGWREYGSYLIVLQAGCYALQVTWTGGSWHMTFAAGR